MTRDLGGPRLFVKRDDCTGLALGGNKARKLEFACGAALRAGANVIITSGGVQSNHVRQTAAAAAKMGVACECVVVDPLRRHAATYLHNGNVLLDRMLGARLVRVAEGGEAMAAAVERLADHARRQGKRPFVIPLGASDALGSLGYVAAARELLEQCAAANLQPSHIVVATGSAGTQAGLLTGLRLCGSAARVVGIGVREPAETATRRVRALIQELLVLLQQSPDCVSDSDVDVRDDYLGGGYGIAGPAALAAMLLAAEREALVLDPVYTGKAMAGLLDLVRRGALPDARDVIFMHTGGTPGAFAYAEEIAAACAQT